MSRPDETRLEQVERPVVPQPTVACGHDTSALCNSDAEAAGVLSGYDAALAEANRRICWLKAWFGYPTCSPGEP